MKVPPCEYLGRLCCWLRSGLFLLHDARSLSSPRPPPRRRAGHKFLALISEWFQRLKKAVLCKFCSSIYISVSEVLALIQPVPVFLGGEHITLVWVKHPLLKPAGLEVENCLHTCPNLSQALSFSFPRSLFEATLAFICEFSVATNFELLITRSELLESYHNRPSAATSCLWKWFLFCAKKK